MTRIKVYHFASNHINTVSNFSYHTCSMAISYFNPQSSWFAIQLPKMFKGFFSFLQMDPKAKEIIDLQNLSEFHLRGG